MPSVLIWNHLWNNIHILFIMIYAGREFIYCTPDRVATTLYNATAQYEWTDRDGGVEEMWAAGRSGWSLNSIVILVLLFFYGPGRAVIHSFIRTVAQPGSHQQCRQASSQYQDGLWGNSAWMVVIVGGGNKKLKRNILLWFHFMCVGMVFAMQMWFSYRINKYEMWLSHNWNLIIIGLKLFCHPPPTPDSQSYLQHHKTKGLMKKQKRGLPAADTLIRILIYFLLSQFKCRVGLTPSGICFLLPSYSLCVAYTHLVDGWFTT